MQICNYLMNSQGITTDGWLNHDAGRTDWLHFFFVWETTACKCRELSSPLSTAHPPFTRSKPLTTTKKPPLLSVCLGAVLFSSLIFDWLRRLVIGAYPDPVDRSQIQPFGSTILFGLCHLMWNWSIIAHKFSFRDFALL